MSSKIKDGLFLGDIDAAQDAEFLQLNGIVHIVNCVPRQVPNLFQQSLGLAYVSCDLDEVLKRSFFDLKNRQFMSIVQLIDRALERTESVLVHSLNGANRSPSVMMGYLMVKYCWGVDKAYEFLLAKRPDIKPHESYIDQLCLLEAQLQTLFGSRANEQQLYEWHPSLADPRSDELVLIHTYLNAAAAASAKQQPPLPQKAPHAKASHQRRLSWIDQLAQMKKLYPSLMIKPERPPGHSYSDMLPTNGWVDVLNPSSTVGAAPAAAAPNTTIAKPITAFMEATTTATTAATATTKDVADSDDDTLTVGRGHRVHSFSMPKRRGVVELENDQSPSDSNVSDREEQDLTIDVVSKQPTPRYQQQTTRGGGTNNRLPPRQQTQPQPQPQQTTSRPQPPRGTGTSSVPVGSASGAIRAIPGFPSGGIRATTMSSTTKASAAPKTPEFTRPIKPTAKPSLSKPPPTTKPAFDRGGSGSSTGSNSARGSFSGDLPLPQTTSTFSVRRAVIETDPWSIHPSSAASVSASSSSTAARPRTAPPRLRKKDSDLNLFPPPPQNMKNNKNAAADASFLFSSSGINRVNIDVSSLPSGPPMGSSMHRRMSNEYGTPSAAAAASFRTQKLSSRTASAAAAAASASASAAAAAARPRTMRAHWK